MATNVEDSHGAHPVAPSSLRLRFAEARRASNSQGGGDFETNSSSFSEIMDRRRRPSKLENKAVPVPLKKRYMGETVPRPCPYLLQTCLHMRDARHRVLRMHCACTAHTTRALQTLCFPCARTSHAPHTHTRRRPSSRKREGEHLASAPSMAPSGPRARRSRAPAMSGGRGIGYARQAHSPKCLRPAPPRPAPLHPAAPRALPLPPPASSGDHRHRPTHAPAGPREISSSWS